MRPIRRIVVHSSDTQDTGYMDTQAIRRYHMEVKGWSAIGYHTLIDRIAFGGPYPNTYEAVLGRPLEQPGAHVEGHNADTLGLCVVGKFDEIPPPAQALAKAVGVCVTWCRLFGLTPSDIVGHRELNPGKTCPGKQFDLSAFRELVRQELGADS